MFRLACFANSKIGFSSRIASTLPAATKIGPIPLMQRKFLSEKSSHEIFNEGIGKIMKTLDELKVANVEEKVAIQEQIANLKEKVDKLTEENVILDGKFDELLKKTCELMEQIKKEVAKNVLKPVYEWAKYDSNAFKWNEDDCGPKLGISKHGLLVKHYGPFEPNSVRAVLPIPPFNLDAKIPTIGFYFEMEIIKKIDGDWDIDIGFCTRQYPLEGVFLGEKENSIGISRCRTMWINGKKTNFGNATYKEFRDGDVIGLGLVHHNPLIGCFAYLNGQMMGNVELPAKFAKMELFPAATLYQAGESIRANFSKGGWSFKQFNK